MSRRRMSRSWPIVLILLALFIGVSSVAVVTGIPADPVPEAPVAEIPEPEPEVEPPPPPMPALRPARARPAPTPRPAPPVVDRIAKARRSANETAAIATSRNVTCAQAQMQATARIDEDNDGTGEFGTFAEMSGGVSLRGSQRSMNPPVLSGAFRTVDRLGRVTRNGYVHAIYLPGSGGRSESEQPEGGLLAGTTDVDLAEKTWCMYAWPKEYGKTGQRTFMVNQSGDTVSTDCPDYTGEHGPAADAAFEPDPATSGTILGRLAIGKTGNDGRTWKQVN